MDKADITLKQLRGLLAVEEMRSFRRAADRLGVTQPALSAQIQGLEDALGLLLVERSRSGALLTPAGREVAQHARAVVDATTALKDYAAALDMRLSGSIRLGVTPTIGPYLLPSVVAELRRSHPELRLYIREGAPGMLADQLTQGAHDLILTQMPLQRGDLTVMELFRERLFLTVGADHPLAAQPRVAPADLEGLEVLSLDANYMLHEQVKSLCDEFGARFARDYAGTSLDALRLMTGTGAGVAFLPALYVRSEIRPGSEVAARPIRGRSTLRSIGLAWRGTSGLGSTYRRLGEIMCAVFRRLDEELDAQMKGDEG